MEEMVYRAFVGGLQLSTGIYDHTSVIAVSIYG